ncbi:MAG: zinc ABC transporter substrate-binding protein [Planctomycetota bacterium]
MTKTNFAYRQITCWLLLLVACCSLVGCPDSNKPDPDADSGSESTGESAQGQSWVATTGHIADALRRISDGANVDIKQLCGPGVDPHSYSASTADVKAMANCNAIYYNGFHLEARLHDLLEHEFAEKAWGMAGAFPEDARLDWEEDGVIDPEAPFDPHIWNHLPGWSKCVEGLIEQVCKTDPDNEDLYRKNGEAYVAEITKTHQEAIKKFESIAKDKRVLVSAHDAFNYFSTVYEFESIAVLGIGNDAEADVKRMREVAKTVCDRKVPVIFLENITNPKVTEALQEACEAQDWSVEIAEKPLYSDDLGVDAPLDTFLGAFDSNVTLIAESLGK